MSTSQEELSADSLLRAAKEQYGLDRPISIRRIYEGRALNYYLSGSDDEWLLKVFQGDYGFGRVQLAAEFAQHLAAGKCPVQPFENNLGGSPVSYLNERPMILVKWIAGVTPPPNSLSNPNVLRGLGRLCGLTHRVAGDFPRASEMETLNPSDTLSLSERRLKFEERTYEAARASLEIRDEVETRRSILDDLGPDLHQSERLAVKQAIHGDFYCAHSVWQSGTTVGIIDAMGGFHFTGWEIMRCFAQSIPQISQMQVDSLEELWSNYVLGYSSECPVTPTDIEIAYDVYLLHLILSSYGLRMPRSEPWHDRAILDSLVTSHGRGYWK